MFNKPTGTASGIKNRTQIERDNQKAKQAGRKRDREMKAREQRIARMEKRREELAARLGGE